MAKLVGISERYEYQHNARKKIENRIYVTRGNSKYAILFEQTTCILCEIFNFCIWDFAALKANTNFALISIFILQTIVR